MSAVEQVLERRSRQDSRRPVTLALGAAAFVHLLVLAAALLLPRLSPPPEPFEFVPVTILPAQALGVPRPAPPRQEAAPTQPAPAAAPEPEEPEPTPPPREEAPVLPEPKPKPERREPRPEPRPARPEPAPARPARPAPSSPTAPPAATAPRPTPPGTAAPGETGDQAGRRGGATGTPLGTTAFGSRVPGLDPDFTYGYYIDRLLSAIDGNWIRPRVDGSVRTIVAFRIERDGKLLEPPTVKESSGYNAFDLAALRAVQNAAPFPPLPRGYRNDSLNVNLIVR